MSEGDLGGGSGPRLSSGARLGPYEIVAHLASGGMGEVYRARDPRLEREVAIKVLGPRKGELAGDPRRLEQEARAIAALNHPNVLAVFDVGRAGELPFVVAELLDGETLRERLARGPLPWREGLELGRQVASGLAAAHAKGIVHRDLKPENLFVTRDGRVKVLDFGLARRETDAPFELTRPGMIVGTLGYMAPEQVRGDAVHDRADVFALGAVLHEAVSGVRAFARATPLEVLRAVVEDEPPPLPGHVPVACARVLGRCLAKDASVRPSALELGRELTSLLESGGGLSGSGVGGPAATNRKRSLAVLPFRDLGGGGDTGHLSLGLADATITELARLPSIVVRPTSAILRFAEAGPDPQQAGRELDVDLVVEGSFQRAGSKLRATVRLVSTAEGRVLWASQHDAGFEELFAMQDEVARRVRQALSEEPAAARGGAPPAASPASAPDARAYELYLRGRARLTRETLAEFVEAASWLEQARERDPQFALAWAWLADVYMRIDFDFQPDAGWFERAEAAVARALALEPQLPEARYARARLLWSPRRGFDYPAAMRDLLAALAVRPNLDEAHVRLAVLLYHAGLVEQGLHHLERALAISPGHLLARYHVGFCRWHQARYEEALAISEEVARAAPASWIHYQTGLCQLRLGRLEAAAQTAELMERLVPGEPMAHPIRGLVAALRGEREAALESARLTEENGASFGHYHHAQYDLACMHAMLGDRARSLEWLRAAARNGYPCLSLLEKDPLLTPLRAEPDFAALLAAMRSECEGYRRLYDRLRDPEAAATATQEMLPSERDGG